MSHVVRVRLHRGPEQLLNKFRELRVRSWVIRRLAHIHIERHIADLGDRPGVLKIHARVRQSNVQASLKEHVNERVAVFYPDKGPDGEVQYGRDGQVLPEIRAMAQRQRSAGEAKASESAFDMKQTATRYRWLTIILAAAISSVVWM